MSPARRTISVAVASSRGSGGGVLDTLDHEHFHTAFGSALDRHFIHEAANQEDATAGGLEDVLGRPRVAEAVRVEAAAFVPHPNRQAHRRVVLERRELDVYPLPRV